MTTQSISIHRALAELKLLQKRIERAAGDAFLGAVIGERVPKGYGSIAELEGTVKGNLDSAKALIERRKKIKAAIIASNAVTQVMIAGREMTVAEAIDRRDTGIDFDKLLLHSMKTQLQKMNVQIARQEQELEQKAEQYITNMFDKKDNYDQSEIDAARAKYIANAEPKLIDPSNLRKEIEELEKQIEDFELEVDFSLSESNTVTMIQV